ncbi:efflux RND transporter permease subunit, partial [Pseudomonas syringae group genomosp. 7]|uniref:efflux RND transporter permease subunit n=1 Tax=Pseudomonas syringae group genomosp. 7 TaxID=251699 RepID=UPI00377009A1
HNCPAYLGYIVFCAGMVWMFMRIPASFLPEEDQGVIFAQIQTPAGSSTERTQEVIENMREDLLTKESGAGKSVFSVSG